MLFFLACALIWAFRVPVVNGVPVSFNSDEPSHFLIVRYIAKTGELPPYTSEYYESAHPPLADYVEAGYMHLWPTPAQVYALRLFSTMLGMLTLWIIYRTARLIIDPWSSATATACVACLPMFVMFSASVTNDCVAVLISTLTLYVIVRGLGDGLSKKSLNLLCVLVGLAGIAKYTCLGLVPVSIGAVIYDCRRSKKSWIVPTLSIIASFVLIAGWWYLRNQMLYGDPFRSRAEAEMGMFTGRASPASLFYWWSTIKTLTGSFLGIYPGSPEWPPSVYETITALFAVVVIFAVAIAAKRKWTPIKIALGSFAVLVAAVVLEYQINHYQPHGRLMSPALAVFAIGIVQLRHVIPSKQRKFVALSSLMILAGLTLAVILQPIQ